MFVLYSQKNQKGIALVTMLFFLIIVTALATGAIMLATVQVKVAGSVACWESALAGAEGGVDYVIPLIQSVQYGQVIPDEFAASVNITDPTLVDRLTDPDNWNATGNLTANPNVTIIVGGFSVPIVITTIGTVYTAGGAIEPGWAYHGGAAGNSLMTGYEIMARASTPSGSCAAQKDQVFWLKTVL